MTPFLRSIATRPHAFQGPIEVKRLVPPLRTRLHSKTPVSAVRGQRRQELVQGQDYIEDLMAKQLEWTEPGRREPLAVNSVPRQAPVPT